MKIKFLGLVAHVTLDQGLPTERQVAALVAGPGHTARLSVGDGFVPFDETHGTSADGTTCFPLHGRVSWLDFPHGRAAVVDKLGVPSLLSVTSGSLQNLTPQIEDPSPSPSVFHAVIDLPAGGRLAPADYFTNEVDFNGNAHGPMPRTMEYQVATEVPDTHEMRIWIGGTTIRLLDDADIVISNLCSDGVSDGQHFQNYKLLFKPQPSIVLNPTESNRPCSYGTPGAPLPQCALESTLQVDCGNGGLP
jgi:hypothetical protein